MRIYTTTTYIDIYIYDLTVVVLCVTICANSVHFVYSLIRNIDIAKSDDGMHMEIQIEIHTKTKVYMVACQCVKIDLFNIM